MERAGEEEGPAGPAGHCPAPAGVRRGEKGGAPRRCTSSWGTVVAWGEDPRAAAVRARGVHAARRSALVPPERLWVAAAKRSRSWSTREACASPPTGPARLFRDWGERPPRVPRAGAARTGAVAIHAGRRRSCGRGAPPATQQDRRRRSHGGPLRLREALLVRDAPGADDPLGPEAAFHTSRPPVRRSAPEALRFALAHREVIVPSSVVTSLRWRSLGTTSRSTLASAGVLGSAYA